MWNHVVNKLTRQHRTKICDIIDGSSYKEHCKPGGFLHNPNNFSLVFNTDGVPIFKSSSVGVWPIYLAINELPKCQRYGHKEIDLFMVSFLSVHLSSVKDNVIKWNNYCNAAGRN